MYLKRIIDSELLAWKHEKTNRKPLILRGARQVGKSTAVRQLSKHFDNYIEVNFEEHRQVHFLFKGDLSPKELCNDLSVLFKTPIEPGKTLLFFDEIQQCLPAISSLRFFYEKYPELHVIAAGSLLEFALNELPSFGVGRVRSLFVNSFSFNEFLSASGEDRLLEIKEKASCDKPLSEAVHNKLLRYYKVFLVIGGMPEVVSEYITNKNIELCQRIIDDLILSLKADFSKYKKRVSTVRLTEVFQAISNQMGGKFVYAKVHSESGHKQIKEAVELLIMAGLVIPVTHSSSNGIPLGAEGDIKKRKMLIYDTGIFQRIVGLEIKDILFEDEFNLINKGAVAELSVGLELIKSMGCYQQAELFYWQRETASSNAEIDYLIQKNKTILPIEVKSGTKGSMQSLFIFMKEKKVKKGFRFSNENFAKYDQIEVYPIYAITDFFYHIE